MVDLSVDIAKALSEKAPEECPIRRYDNSSSYAPHQVRIVPESLRGIICLYERISKEPEFKVFEPRFDQRCQLEGVINAMTCDHFKVPPKSNVEFCPGWKVIIVVPEEQVPYSP